MMDSVVPNELLARYIVSSKWFRKQDQTVKQDAFIPSDDPLELSVTRHLNLTENGIWNIGRGIAGSRSRTLHGRADVKTAHVIAQHLRVVSYPISDNSNHANIVNWPSDKDARKMCALEIARAARFIVNPDEAEAQIP
jgi:hypothetical protein